MKIEIWDSKNQELAETFNENWDLRPKKSRISWDIQWKMRSGIEKINNLLRHSVKFVIWDPKKQELAETFNEN